MCQIIDQRHKRVDDETMTHSFILSVFGCSVKPLLIFPLDGLRDRREWEERERLKFKLRATMSSLLKEWSKPPARESISMALTDYAHAVYAILEKLIQVNEIQQ